MKSELLLKITMGTRSDNDRRLCDSCTQSLVIRGPVESEEVVYCTWMERNVPFKVTECNRYISACRPSLWDMKRIAFVLNDASPKRLNIGFDKSDIELDADED